MCLKFKMYLSKHFWEGSLVPLTLVWCGSPNPPLSTNGQGTPAADMATLKIWSYYFLSVYGGESQTNATVCQNLMDTLRLYHVSRIMATLKIYGDTWRPLSKYMSIWIDTWYMTTLKIHGNAWWLLSKSIWQ